VAKIRVRPHRKGIVRRSVLVLRQAMINWRLWYFRRIVGMDIGADVQISLRANLDMTNPRGVHIGEGTHIAFHAVIFAHDMSRVLHTDTYVGRNCFIGAHSIILPGIRVGDECVVGTGSVVTKDVPSGSIVAGNPAKVVRSGIRTGKWGVLMDAYNEALAMANANERRPTVK
jgi:acetyltransferase-like isoleucine patch superfamily enzyme